MFKNLEEYYEYLETDNKLIYDSYISKKIQTLRDKVKDNELKTQCSYEIFFSDFRMEKGEIKPLMSGSIGDYPNLSLFDDDLNYIKSRAEIIENPKYKAKYYHLLWGSKHKHIDYAKNAIDNYFLFLKSASIPVDDNLSDHAFANYFKNAFILSQTINYKKEELLNFLVSILDTKIINGFQECILMKFIVEEGKKIDITFFQSFFIYSNKIIENTIYPDWVKEYLELLIMICPKIKDSPKPYHNKLGEFYIAKAEKAESFIIHDIYLKALDQYKKAVNKEKIEDVTVLIEKAKPTINLKSVKVEFTDEKLQEYWETIIKLTDELTENGQSKDIYEHIIHSLNIFPKAQELNENVSPGSFDFMSVMTFDINKNVSRKKTSFINPYSLHIQNFSINHLWMVLSKGVKNGKVSFESLMDYLKKYSWYGQDFTYPNAEAELEGFNWIELLSPSLFSFFVQCEIDIKLEKNSKEGYILATDSLVLKFEGLLREFSRNIGAQTIEIKEDGTKERISFEKLLENPKIKEMIPEDNIALFKYLFTSEGINLRNNIAHCFYKTKNYSLAAMLLLIAALLKLGNYKFKPK